MSERPTIIDTERETTAESGGNAADGSGAFVSAARVVAGATLASRVVGLARDAVCARVFGAGGVWSAFAFAFLLPNLFRRLFGEGALSAAFLPEYARLLKRDPELAARFATTVVGAVAAGLTVIAGLGELALLAAWKLELVEPGGELALKLAMVMLPFMPIVCVTALVGSRLQTHRVFFPTAAAPIILNVFIIAAASAWSFGFGAGDETTIFAVAASVVAAGFVQLVWSLGALRGKAEWRGWRGDVREPCRRVLGRMAPVVIGLGALQINALLDGLIAYWPELAGPELTAPVVGRVAYPMDESSTAVLFFAQRLYHFPLGVFGIALATAIFPALARTADDEAKFGGTLRRGIRLGLFIGLPASAGLLLVREELAGFVLYGGEFDRADVGRVSATLAGYGAAVWAYMLNHTLTRAFYARDEMRTPMRIALFFVALNLALNLVLIWPLREAGLAWSTAICAVGQTVALSLALKRTLGLYVFGGDVWRSIWRSVIATVAMSGAIVLGLWGARELGATEAQTWAGYALRLGAIAGAGAAIYTGLSLAMRRAELRWLVERGADA